MVAPATPHDLESAAQRPPAGSRPGAGRPGPLISATVAVLVATTFIPLGYVAWAFATTGWDQAYALIVRPRVGELLRRLANHLQRS